MPFKGKTVINSGYGGRESEGKGNRERGKREIVMFVFAHRKTKYTCPPTIAANEQ